MLFDVYLSYVMRVHQVHSIVLCDSKSRNIKLHFVKGYCIGFQHAFKSLEMTVSVLSERMSKTARKNAKGLKSYKELKF